MPALLLTCVWACTSTLGRDFSRPDYTTYSSERVAEQDITARYGPPYSRGRYTSHGLVVDTLNYMYVLSKSNDHEVTSIAKKCSFYFSDGHYLGYEFGSGFQDEQLPLADQKLSQLTKGQTRKAEALALFGSPTAALRYPATPEDNSVEGDSIVSYEYQRYSKEGAREVYKFLMLTFDSSNVLKRIDLDSRERAHDTTPAQADEKRQPNHWGAVGRPLPE